MKERNNLIAIIGHFVYKGEDNFVDNKREDLSNMILYASTSTKKAKEKLHSLVLNEKNNSWIADSLKMPFEYREKNIVQIETENEFWYEDTSTKQFTHLQIIRKIIDREEE